MILHLAVTENVKIFGDSRWNLYYFQIFRLKILKKKKKIHKDIDILTLSC